MKPKVVDTRVEAFRKIDGKCKKEPSQMNANSTSSGTCTPPIPAPTAKPKTGAEVFVDVLQKEGVKTMFGYPGGVVLPLFDALYDSPIHFVLSRHEQGATHMADGFARATGEVGVVLVTSGPGACNTVTGLATAHMDSIPLVVFTGQVKTPLIGNDAFQEADTTGITRPITKHNCIVKHGKDLARLMHEAFHIARTGRPGPVLVDLPVDVSASPAADSNGGLEIDLPGYRPRTEGHLRQIRRAAEAINAAERPVFYVGGGVIASNASAELRAVVEKANVPVTTTLLGLGCFDESDPKSLHMLGMHGTAYANFAVQECDVLVAIGARFDDRVTGDVRHFAPGAKIVHIDIDPSSISKNVKVDIPVVGDAKNILRRLLEFVEYRERKAWFERIGKLKDKYPLTYERNGEGIRPQYVIEEISRQTKGEAIICTGVGQHQMWAAQFYQFKHPRHFITSGGLGTMGYGFPAALGAQVACPDALVIDIDGDSSFSMTLNELPTAVENKLPVKVCLLNNGYMGMVRQWQELFYNHRYSKSYLQHPDFAQVAEAFGAVGLRVTRKEEVPEAVSRMLAEERCCVADFHVEPEENVWPMVAAGKKLHEMSGLPSQSSERV